MYGKKKHSKVGKKMKKNASNMYRKKKKRK